MKLLTLFVVILVFSNCAKIQTEAQNLIVNGDFSSNDCTKASCFVNGQTSLPGWISDNEIQVGYGNLYNTNMDSTRVVQLDANGLNICIRQNLKGLQAGQYRLQLTYAARMNSSFSDCQFSISYAGQTLKNITPVDYLPHIEKVQFKLDKTYDQAQLKFCGIGNSNGLGSVITKISLIVLQQINTVVINSGGNSVVSVASVASVAPVASQPQYIISPVIVIPTIPMPSAVAPNSVVSSSSSQESKVSEITLSKSKIFLGARQLFFNVTLSSITDGDHYNYFIDNANVRGAWTAKNQDLNQFIQFDSNRTFQIVGVVTQGRWDYDQWVSKYSIQYSNDNTNGKYLPVFDISSQNFFYGNYNRNTKVQHIFKQPIMVKSLRIRPIQWYGLISMRADILIEKQISL